MGSATHTTDMQHYQTQIPYLWAFQDIKTLILVLKEIICEQSHAKSSREFILLELFCCDYWRIDDDRAVAKRRGGSCARFADNSYKLTCNPRK